MINKLQGQMSIRNFWIQFEYNENKKKLCLLENNNYHGSRKVI